MLTKSRQTLISTLYVQVLIGNSTAAIVLAKWHGAFDAEVFAKRLEKS